MYSSACFISCILARNITIPIFWKDMTVSSICRQFTIMSLFSYVFTCITLWFCICKKSYIFNILNYLSIIWMCFTFTLNVNFFVLIFISYNYVEYYEHVLTFVFGQ